MAQRMNVAVRGPFVTPVAALDVPGADGFNPALSAAFNLSL